MNVLRTALSTGSVQGVGLCDVDQRPLRAAADEISTLTGTRPALYEDYRALLETEHPDIVIVAPLTTGMRYVRSPPWSRVRM